MDGRDRSGHDEKRGETGSVLIEAMVSAAIIAMTLIAMYTSIITSAAHNRMAEARRTAMMIAQSELAAVGTLIPTAPGTTEGTAGDFYWRVDISPYQQPGQGPQPTLGQVPNPTGTLCLVTVTVADQRRAPLAVLTTLTLARGG
jgi:type II secretory pathway pseudopilin PulG